jgi:hypothetical protein
VAATPSIGAARQAFNAAIAEMLAVPDAELEAPWRWRPDDQIDADVRYGLYRIPEALEEAVAAIARGRAGPEGVAEPMAPAVPPLAAATVARWALHGVLAPLTPAELDADPGGGEWSIRLVLGHTIASQRAYGWGTAWWLANPHDASDPGLPERVPEEVWSAMPDEATTEAEGSLADLRSRLDAVLELATERLAGCPDERLGQGARWSGFPVTIAFRLGRWSSHIREHTIQVEKTLVMLGRAPTEPERLARNLLAAYGRAESTVFGRAAHPEVVAAAADRVAAGAGEAREAIASAGAVAGS